MQRSVVLHAKHREVQGVCAHTKATVQGAL